MKKTIQITLVSLIALSTIFVSCNKIDAVNNNDNNEDLGTQSDDQSRLSSGTDEIANDANDITANYAAFTGRPGSVTAMPCNANAVLDSTATLRRITVTYNGLNCYGTHNRAGVVVLTMPLSQHWADAGAVLTIESRSLRITRVRDGKSLTINGNTTITNVTGGRLINLATSGPVIHDIASTGISVSFDNGTSRDWKISKRRTFTYDNGIVITITGTHTEGGVTNISEWGTNRFGDAFTASITNPLAIRQDCNFRLVSGQITHQGRLGTLVATFGLDSNGVATTCPGLLGYYYFKAVWTGINGVVRTVIYPY